MDGLGAEAKAASPGRPTLITNLGRGRSGKDDEEEEDEKEEEEEEVEK